jgi:hypothetical protein
MRARKRFPLEVAEGLGYRKASRADGGQHSAQDAHYQREQDAEEQKVQGYFEGEGQVGEGLEVHGAGG